MVVLEYLVEQILEWIGSKLPFLSNIKVLIILFSLYILYLLYYTEKLPRYINSHRKSVTSITLLIILLAAFSLVDESNYFQNPPKDRFAVAISPFYLKNSGDTSVDYSTPTKIAEQIENDSEGRITVKLLDIPPITNDAGLYAKVKILRILLFMEEI